MRQIGVVAILAAFLLPAGACHREDDDPDSFEQSDLNIDGRADVAVGAPFDDAAGAGSNRGRVYVYFGPLGATPTILNGDEDGARFGTSVAVVGDFNGDGRPDLAVGAPFHDGDGIPADSGDDRGQVTIFFGGAPFPASSIKLTGTEPGGHFGAAVAGAGDINADGVDDLLVGAPEEDAGGTDRGRAYLFLGGVGSPSSTPYLTFSGSEDNAQFGASVNTAGLLNADPFFDWMIGAPGDDADGDTTTDSSVDRGRVFIYRGAQAADNIVDTVINGSEDFGNLGTSVAGLFDVNLDGLDDVLVGAPDEDGDGNTATNVAPFLGRAYLFFGSTLNGVSTINSFAASRIFTGTEAGARFGAFVNRLGDVNSGGADDFIIGAPQDDADGNATDENTDRGRCFLYFGGSALDTVADVTVSGTENGARFGTWAGSGGDVDGDGIRDFLVGAPGDDLDGNGVDDGLDRGRILFFRGGTLVDSTPDDSLEGAPEDGAQAGTSGA